RDLYSYPTRRSSDLPDITIDLERCPQQPCNFKPLFRLMEIIPGGFMYYVELTNPTGSPIAVHLSSFNGYGTFVPSVLVLNPGFNSFVVEFLRERYLYAGSTGYVCGKRTGLSGRRRCKITGNARSDIGRAGIFGTTAKTGVT